MPTEDTPQIQSPKPLTSYTLSDHALTVQPATSRRQWMDDALHKQPYRCLPMVMANQAGWEMLCPCDFSVEWDGESTAASVTFTFPDSTPEIARRQVSSHFGMGIITFMPEQIFKTPPGYNLWLKGPSNYFKDGIAPLEGIVETDWLPFTATMNWKITSAGLDIKFKKGEPICHVLPWPRDFLESFAPDVRPITANPELQEDFEQWSQSRSNFLEKLHIEGTAENKAQFEKKYVQGVDSDGKRIIEHQTKLSLKPFKKQP